MENIGRGEVEEVQRKSRNSVSFEVLEDLN